MRPAPAVAAVALLPLSPVASFIVGSRACTFVSCVKETFTAPLSTRRPRSRKQHSWDDRGGKDAGLQALPITERNRASIEALHFSSKAMETPDARPALPADFYSESLLDKVALALFRRLVQNEIGYKSSQSGYSGLIDEAKNYMVVQGATNQEQQDMVVRVLSTIAGPAVPPVYRIFMAPWPWAPFLTALFTPPFFKFLVGPNKMDVRKDETLGGVFVERCRFLEETNCKGLCTNMCKVPTERYFEETLGLTMSMEPDFDTYECRLSFGLAAPSMEEDDSVPRGCLNGCSCKAMGAQVATSCSKQ